RRTHQQSRPEAPHDSFVRRSLPASSELPVRAASTAPLPDSLPWPSLRASAHTTPAPQARSPAQYPLDPTRTARGHSSPELSLDLDFKPTIHPSRAGLRRQIESSSMRLCPLIPLLLLASFTLAALQANAADSYSIVHAYPHDQHAFTQGLVYVDGHLYESTGMNGQSSLREDDLDSGRIQRMQLVADQYFA